MPDLLLTIHQPNLYTASCIHIEHKSRNAEFNMISIFLVKGCTCTYDTLTVAMPVELSIFAWLITLANLTLKICSNNWNNRSFVSDRTRKQNQASHFWQANASFVISNNNFYSHFFFKSFYQLLLAIHKIMDFEFFSLKSVTFEHYPVYIKLVGKTRHHSLALVVLIFEKT